MYCATTCDHMVHCTDLLANKHLLKLHLLFRLFLLPDCGAFFTLTFDVFGCWKKKQTNIQNKTSRQLRTRSLIIKVKKQNWKEILNIKLMGLDTRAPNFAPHQTLTCFPAPPSCVGVALSSSARHSWHPESSPSSTGPRRPDRPPQLRSTPRPPSPTAAACWKTGHGMEMEGGWRRPQTLDWWNQDVCKSNCSSTYLFHHLLRLPVGKGLRRGDGLKLQKFLNLFQLLLMTHNRATRTTCYSFYFGTSGTTKTVTAVTLRLATIFSSSIVFRNSMSSGVSW